MKQTELEKIIDEMSPEIRNIISDSDNTDLGYLSKMNKIGDLSNYKSFKAFDYAYSVYTTNCDFDTWKSKIWYNGKGMERFFMMCRDNQLERLLNIYEMYCFWDKLTDVIIRRSQDNPNSVLNSYAEYLQSKSHFNRDFGVMMFFKRRVYEFVDKYYNNPPLLIELIDKVNNGTVRALSDVLDFSANVPQIDMTKDLILR